MRVITVARRYVAEKSTSLNCLEHGCGALNINVCRIGTDDNLNGGAYSEGGRKGLPGDTREGAAAGMFVEGGGRLPGGYEKPSGRWPSNLLLQHQLGCKVVGEVRDPGYVINRFTDGAKPFGGGAGHAYESESQSAGMVPVYECAYGCPVVSLDAQGVARFFKQTETDMSKNDDLPQELWDYLITMISPPKEYDPNVIAVESLKDVDWSSYSDQSVHGIIAIGDPTEYLQEVDRVLKPGAHFLMISEKDDLNAEAVCNVEEFGYEVRDSICYLDSEEDKFHYVAKASSRERNAGLEDKSTHPTVKPVKIMQALLGDVPEGDTVCDPFMGSGTTGIACLRTGHDFIGIEKEAEYFQIANDRIHHWNEEGASRIGAHVADIESDASTGGAVEDNLEEELEGLFG